MRLYILRRTLSSIMAVLLGVLCRQFNRNRRLKGAAFSASAGNSGGERTVWNREPRELKMLVRN